jgi:hypothetical protein
MIFLPIITGIAALVGGFIGAYIHRRTQHQHWLLQRRAEVFSEFLFVFAKCQDEAAKFLRESPESRIEVTQPLIDIFQPAFVHAKLVRLFVKQNSKEKVEQLVREIYALISTLELGAPRFEPVVQKLEELQSVFEDNLQKPKW